MSDYDEMEAGWQLDHLVAERVLGCERLARRHNDGMAVPERYRWRWRMPPPRGAVISEDIPEYSTDIAAAWQVVEAMKGKGWGLHTLSSCSPLVPTTRVVFCHDFAWALGLGNGPEIAICRAALNAMEIVK